MYPLPGSSGEDESDASELEPESSVDLEELWTWYIRFVILGSMAVTLYRMMHDDEIRLRIFHATARIFGNVARLFGGLALKAEKEYYRVVDSIPH
jgi:hypothetical protein